MTETAPEGTFDEVMEAEFRRAEQLLLHPPRVQGRALLLLASIVAFMVFAMAQRSTSMVDLGMLVGVLLVHELGHAMAMRLFGYADVRIFFIPFLGAAAAGRKRGAAAWKQAIVLLAGPLPGIAIGCGLAFVNQPHARTLALQLLLVNGFNLLPVTPLDGGRLFQLVLFSRRRWLEILFIGATGTILLVGSLLAHLWALAAIGLVVVMALGRRRRVLEVAQRWRTRKVPDDPAALDDPERRMLFRAAWDMLPAERRAKPRVLAATMTEILESAAQVPPSWSVIVGVLLVWLVGLTAALAGTVGAAAVPHWRVVAHDAPRFAIEMPRPPRTKTVGGHPLLTARVGLRRDYAISWNPLPPPRSQAWLEMRERLLLAHGRLVEQLAAPDPERRFVYLTGKGSTIVARLVCASGYAYAILAAAPSDEPDSRRFVDSFTATP